MTHWRRMVSGLGVMAVLTVVASFGFAKSALADDAYDRFLTLYDMLLADHIRPMGQDATLYNGVDYDGWAANPAYMQARQLFLKSDPDTFQTDATRMAFWINAYNFLTIDLIIQEEERESIKAIGGLFSNPWKSHHWSIAGRDYTLDQIEHAILRPMGDPRIHFAINCASVSCPDLRAESYRADTLNAQLDEQTKLTLENREKGLRIDGNKVYASKIFDWFDEDFDKGDVRGWLQRYLGRDIPKRLKYMPYDWSLNKTD